VMSTTLGMLQLAARALGSPSPVEVLEQVNETLLARIPQNMFVTCFYAILDPQSGTLRYANAGHDLPYLRRVGYVSYKIQIQTAPRCVSARRSRTVTRSD
jgi:serine phosphatase RsbU (regulator of sigma subunit)